jgi:hypothetical protein
VEQALANVTGPDLKQQIKEHKATYFISGVHGIKKTLCYSDFYGSFAVVYSDNEWGGGGMTWSK